MPYTIQFRRLQDPRWNRKVEIFSGIWRIIAPYYIIDLHIRDPVFLAAVIGACGGLGEVRHPNFVVVGGLWVDATLGVRLETEEDAPFRLRWLGGRCG